MLFFRTGTWNGSGWVDTGLTQELAQGPSPSLRAANLSGLPWALFRFGVAQRPEQACLSVSRNVPLLRVEVGVLAVHTRFLWPPGSSAAQGTFSSQMSLTLAALGLL